MNETEVIETARQAIFLAIQLSAPILLIGMLVGVVIALFQALTQIQEITLVFVPKIMAIFMAMAFFLPMMMSRLVLFMETLVDRMINLG